MVEEGTALTACCPPGRATPARECGIGEVGMVCDANGVAVEEFEPFRREREVCSAVCARDPGARQQIRDCQENDG